LGVGGGQPAAVVCHRGPPGGTPLRPAPRSRTHQHEGGDARPGGPPAGGHGPGAERRLRLVHGLVLVLNRGCRRGDRPDEAGMVAVATALVVVFVVMPLLAIVVDLGLTRVADGHAGSAADGAALAAGLRYATTAD